MTTAYERSSKFTEERLDGIRNRLEELPLGGAVVLVYGSFARREASTQSDIDYVIVSDGAETASDLNGRVRSEICNIVPNGPSEGGAFGELVNRSEILSNIDRPVMERMMVICGEARMESVVASYNRFLDFLGDSGNRKHLEDLQRSDRDDERFRKIKNEGHHFTRELLKVFEGTFDSTHPIRRAVVF